MVHISPWHRRKDQQTSESIGIFNCSSCLFYSQETKMKSSIMHPVSKFESHEEQTLQFFTSKMRLLGERRYEAMQQSMIGKPSLIQTFGDDLPALSQLYRRVNDAWCLAFYLKKLKKWVPIHQYSPQIPMTLIRTMTTLLSLTVGK